MSRHGEMKIEQQLAIEMLEILWSYHMLRCAPTVSSGGLDFMRETTIVRLLTDDVILRLCKFRDKDSRSVSFDQAFKIFKKRAAPASQISELDKQIQEYRNLTKNLEQHRCARIAHLSKARYRSRRQPPSKILDAVRVAVRIVDRLCDQQNNYSVCGLDLRREFVGDNT